MWRLAHELPRSPHGATATAARVMPVCAVAASVRRPLMRAYPPHKRKAQSALLFPLYALRFLTPVALELVVEVGVGIEVEHGEPRVRLP
jgi:hypothetical protein